MKVVIVGNKIDMEAEREVTKEEGIAMANKYSAEFFESSAKTGEMIHEIFNKLAAVILEKIKLNPPK